MVIEKVRNNSNRNIIHYLARRETGSRIGRRDISLSGTRQFGKRHADHAADYISRIQLLRKFPPKTGTKRKNNTSPPNNFLSNSGTPLN